MQRIFLQQIPATSSSKSLNNSPNNSPNNFLQGPNRPTNITTSTTTSTTSTTTASNGVAGNAAAYAAQIKSQAIKIEDQLLITKYRTDYENVILNLDELINDLILFQFFLLMLQINLYQVL